MKGRREMKYGDQENVAVEGGVKKTGKGEEEQAGQGGEGNEKQWYSSQVGGQERKGEENGVKFEQQAIWRVGKRTVEEKVDGEERNNAGGLDNSYGECLGRKTNKKQYLRRREGSGGKEEVKVRRRGKEEKGRKEK